MKSHPIILSSDCSRKKEFLADNFIISFSCLLAIPYARTLRSLGFLGIILKNIAKFFSSFYHLIHFFRADLTI